MAEAVARCTHHELGRQVPQFVVTQCGELLGVALQGVTGGKVRATGKS